MLRGWFQLDRWIFFPWLCFVKNYCDLTRFRVSGQCVQKTSRLLSLQGFSGESTVRENHPCADTSKMGWGVSILSNATTYHKSCSGLLSNSDNTQFFSTAWQLANLKVLKSFRIHFVPKTYSHSIEASFLHVWLCCLCVESSQDLSGHRSVSGKAAKLEKVSEMLHCFCCFVAQSTGVRNMTCAHCHRLLEK